MNRMNLRQMPWSLLVLLGLTTVQSCREHDVADPINEEELITTIQLSFTKLDETGQPAGVTIDYFWRDVDASGNPEIDEVILDAHAAYAMNLTILDESKTPVENISVEIVAEATDHQFFFPVTGAEISIEYADTDDNGKPLGVRNVVTIGHESTGSLTVILRHQPDKNASGVIDGDPTNAGGETDVEAVFPVTIIE